MCGIAGVLSAGPAPEARLEEARRMIAAVAHRGPDGLRAEAVGGAALAHARLSIIDLACGWQPLHAAGSTVVGNGEIYNYVELAQSLGPGRELDTGSDFEPLLHLYAQEGERAFDRLRGMYALCLVGGDGRTWLLRDPWGIKPLYVSGARFASQPQALGPVRLGREAAEELLALNYVVSHPLRVPPGARLLARTEDGEIRPAPRPVVNAAARSTTRLPSDEAALLARLDSVLEDSVRVHQRSDVPYGLFLSGGIDSAALATLMARLNDRPVTALTCGFDAPGAADERRGAERVARALDLDWREVRFSSEDFRRIAPLAAAALDDPTADYACLPTYRLAEAARDDLTVVLSGEGGDEVFAGYGRYRRALRPRWLGGRAAEPQVDAPFLPDGGAGALARWRAAATAEPPAGATALARAQHADMRTWLPDDLLLKLDRMLMAHGLEGRTPLLDREVVAFARSLPDRWKVRGRWGKWILRRWLERTCPAARPWAHKQGFTTPVADWLAPDAAATGARVAARPGVAAVCDLDAVRAAFAEPARRRSWWPLVFFALWTAIHEEGASPDEARTLVLGEG